MKRPLNYQVSEHDCVPTTILNAISCLIHREEIEQQIVQRVYSICLDKQEGTSGKACKATAVYLNSVQIKVKKSKVEQVLKCEYIKGKSANEILIKETLDSGGVVACQVWGETVPHYILITSHDDECYYVFDPYYKQKLIKDNVIIDQTNRYKYNIKIKKSYFENNKNKQKDARFCMRSKQPSLITFILKKD